MKFTKNYKKIVLVLALFAVVVVISNCKKETQFLNSNNSSNSTINKSIEGTAINIYYYQGKQYTEEEFNTDPLIQAVLKTDFHLSSKVDRNNPAFVTNTLYNSIEEYYADEITINPSDAAQLKANLEYIQFVRNTNDPSYSDANYIEQINAIFEKHKVISPLNIITVAKTNKVNGNYRAKVVADFFDNNIPGTSYSFTSAINQSGQFPILVGRCANLNNINNAIYNYEIGNPSNGFSSANLNDKFEKMIVQFRDVNWREFPPFTPVVRQTVWKNSNYDGPSQSGTDTVYFGNYNYKPLIFTTTLHSALKNKVSSFQVLVKRNAFPY